ncbi:hypothetical protein P872_06015 [Rhodonellum psychrophilum GCM71 = DSM 17998]|uniref:Uncharacterized protein n=2 Tax=Rhodonellum TaxID=336827 RepID=U5BZM4_9BACT|nr:hypothetical protein P872_06015 [Rhodonellum psychrophilum GCM71 = DSM 17998]
MCLGYTKINTASYEVLKEGIKAIKLKHHSPTEIKWNKVSKSRIPLYFELIDFFFKQPIQFRCILVKYKERLDHEAFNKGDHDSFYYKLVYFLLKSATNPPDIFYRSYMDIKDTRGQERLAQIKKVFNSKYKGNSPFTHFQHIRSEENEFLQLTDMFIGAITYKSRKEHLKPGASEVKNQILNYLEGRSGYQLDEGTEPWEEKFNIFDHQPKAK